MDQVHTTTPAQTMAELTFGSLPQLVTDEAFAGLCEAYERTGNLFLFAVADQLIHAENNYAEQMRLRQEGRLLSPDNEARPVSREVGRQVRP